MIVKDPLLLSMASPVETQNIAFLSTSKIFITFAITYET